MAMALMMAMCSPATPADQSAWRPVLPSPQFVVFIDQGRTLKTGTSATTWALLVIPSEPRSLSSLLGAIESQERFDCDAKIHQTLSVNFYSTSGNLIRREPSPGQREATPANEVGDFIMKAACDGEFASGDVFPERPSAMAFGMSWSHAFVDPPPVMARSTARMRRNPPPPTITDLTLPDGPLGAVAEKSKHAVFIDLKHISRDNGKITAGIFQVFAEGSVPNSPSVTQLNSRIAFNCQDKSWLYLGGLAYDANDILVIWLPRSIEVERAADGGAYAAAFNSICGDESALQSNVVVGHVAAVAAGQRMIEAWTKAP